VPTGTSCPFTVCFIQMARAQFTETVTIQVTLGIAGHYSDGIYTATLNGTGTAALTLTPSLTFPSQAERRHQYSTDPDSEKHRHGCSYLKSANHYRFYG